MRERGAVTRCLAPRDVWHLENNCDVNKLRRLAAAGGCCHGGTGRLRPADRGPLPKARTRSMTRSLIPRGGRRSVGSGGCGPGGCRPASPTAAAARRTGPPSGTPVLRLAGPRRGPRTLPRTSARGHLGQEAVAVHLLRLGQAHHLEERGRDVGQHAAARSFAPAKSGCTRWIGTGLMVCAVCGSPVTGSRISSQLPWSAVIASTTFAAGAGVGQLPEAARPPPAPP